MPFARFAHRPDNTGTFDAFAIPDLLTFVTFGRTLVTCLALGALTLAVAQSPLRHANDQRLAFDQASFAEGFARYAGEAEQGEILRLPAKAAGARYVAQPFAPPSDGRAVTVELEASTSKLIMHDAPWSLVSVMIIAFDEQGRHMWWLPRELLRFDKSRDWRSVSLSLPNTDDIGELVLVIYNDAHSGTLNVRNVRTWSSVERPVFTALRYLMVLLWLAAGAALLTIALTAHRTPPRLIVTAVVIALMVLGVAPQPYVSLTLKSAFYAAQDLIRPDPAIASRGDFSRPGESNAERPTEDAPKQGRGAEQGTAPARADAPPVSEVPKAQTLAFAASRYWRPAWLRSDKSQHTLAFGVVTLLAALAWRRRILKVALAAATLSASLQAMQSLTVTRQPDIIDFAHDMYGVALGLALAVLATAVLTRVRRNTAGPD